MQMIFNNYFIFLFKIFFLLIIIYYMLYNIISYKYILQLSFKTLICFFIFIFPLNKKIKEGIENKNKVTTTFFQRKYLD